MHYKQNLAAALLGVATFCAVNSVQAAENGVINYPAGSPGIFIGGFPPIPGLFMISQTSYTHGSGLYDGKGNKAADFDLSAFSQTERFLVSYPAEFLGAHLYSQFVLPAAHVRTEAFGSSATANGLADITITPLILNWSLSKTQSLTFGLDLMPNTGTYSSDKSLNVGTNYGSISPTLAYRYFDPQGFEFAVGPRLIFNGTNKDSVNAFSSQQQDYHTGNAFVLDFNAGYNIGAWKIGVVGGYAHQYGDDTVDGVKAFNIAGLQNGNKLRTLALGPSISYSAGPVQVNLNYQHTVLAENGTKSDTVWANVAVPLWVPPPPQGAPAK
jgi:hypothetical protein